MTSRGRLTVLAPPASAGLQWRSSCGSYRQEPGHLQRGEVASRAACFVRSMAGHRPKSGQTGQVGVRDDGWRAEVRGPTSPRINPGPEASLARTLTWWSSVRARIRSGRGGALVSTTPLV